MSDNEPRGQLTPWSACPGSRFSHAQWELIAPMRPTRTGRAGRAFADAPTMGEAIIYRYQCGIPWRALADRMDLAPPDGGRGHLGNGADKADRRR